MTSKVPVLSIGYSSVPAGKVATLVTCLDMHARPQSHAAGTETSLRFTRWQNPSLEDYRALFRRIGEKWMWVSRLVMDDETLRTLLQDERIEIYVLMDGDDRVGLLELDFRQPGECELAFFGLIEDAIGQGAGRFLMEQAIAKAWEKPISRFWVHTCHLDHPAALAFYKRSGFTPFALMVEVMDDPRLTGMSPPDIAPHVAVIAS